jgi:hypothetical protein
LEPVGGWSPVGKKHRVPQELTAIIQTTIAVYIEHQYPVTLGNPACELFEIVAIVVKMNSRMQPEGSDTIIFQIEYQRI